MFAYNHIEKISKMFDPSIQISASLAEPLNLDFDDDMEWKYNTLDYPISDFYSTIEQFDFTDFDEPLSPQSQIRNHDCMWSGRCTTHPEECNRSNSNKKYVSEKTIQTTVQQQQQQQQNKLKSTTTILTTNNDNNVKLTIQQQQQQQQKQRKQQNVPAGESLLRTRHIKPAIIKVPNMSTNDFLKDRDYIARPDTPLSLDDNPPQFKHDIDLSACTMGSNRTSLLKDSPTEIINILKEHLEDSSDRTPPKVAKYMSNYRPDGLDELIKDMRTLSDFENDSDDDDDDEAAIESDATNDSYNVSNTTITNGQQQLQSNPSSSSSSATKHQTAYITQSMHSDHSYTRSKVRMDCTGLGVQTPSDSEEEIDVVSVGDKNLPTNPSARDRRALQNKITSRMVKTTTGGIHTIARRRISNGSSDDSAYSSKGSPAISSPNAYSSPIRSTTTVSSRKRVNQIATTVSSSSSSSSSIPNAKRIKLTGNNKINGNNQIIGNSRVSSSTSSGSQTPAAKRQLAAIDDTIEKRNQHNDMERQRRIGLKNLFENLKQRIPSLSEKERAPKVNILREATLLCNRLTQEDAEIEYQKQRRHRLQQRLKYLREQLAARGMY